MKQGELSKWLKAIDRYAKVTSVRLNQDDARCVALTASAKKYQSVEDIVSRLPDVFVVEALDGKRSIVGAFTVAEPADPARTPDDIEKNDPQSPAGLMSAYARHIATAYKDGGNAVRDSTKDAMSELTGLCKALIERFNASEEARARELNARSRVLEKLESESSHASGDGLPSMQELFMMSIMGHRFPGMGNGVPPNGAPPNGAAQ